MSKKTFADEAQKRINKYTTRLGKDLEEYDPYAMEALSKELEELMEEQEGEREKLGLDADSQDVAEVPEEELYKCGGKLKKMEKGGKINKNIPDEKGIYHLDETTVTSPEFKAITPLTFKLEAARKGLLSNDILKLEDEKIITEALNSKYEELGLSSYEQPYKIEKKNGKTVYHKNVGRTSGKDKQGEVNMPIALSEYKKGGKLKLLPKHETTPWLSGGTWSKSDLNYGDPLYNINNESYNLMGGTGNLPTSSANLSTKSMGLDSTDALGIAQGAGGLFEGIVGAIGASKAKKLIEGFDTSFNADPYKIGLTPLIESGTLENVNIDPNAYMTQGDYSINYEGYTPEMVELAKEREDIRRRGATVGSTLKRAARSSGSQSQYFNQLNEGLTSAQRAENEAMSKSYQTEEMANVGSVNESLARNAAAKLQADMASKELSMKASQFNADMAGRISSGNMSNYMNAMAANINNRLQTSSANISNLINTKMYNSKLGFDAAIMKKEMEWAKLNGVATNTYAQWANAGKAVGGAGQLAAMAIFAGSDKKFKKDIQRIGIKNGINVYSFKYKTIEYPEFPKGLQVGVIAQEVEHIPYAVLNTSKGKYVNYTIINNILCN